MYKAFCHYRGRCTKFAWSNVPWVSVGLVWRLQSLKMNTIWRRGVKINALTRPLWPAPHLCLKKGAGYKASCITHPNLWGNCQWSKCIVSNVGTRFRWGRGMHWEKKKEEDIMMWSLVSLTVLYWRSATVNHGRGVLKVSVCLRVLLIWSRSIWPTQPWTTTLTCWYSVIVVCNSFALCLLSALRHTSRTGMSSTTSMRTIPETFDSFHSEFLEKNLSFTALYSQR